MALPLVEK
jgi:hypothetical protein